MVDEDAALSIPGELGLAAEELSQLGVGVLPQGAQRGGVEMTPNI